MGQEFSSYEEIVQKVLSEYNRSPKGWHVLLTKSEGLGHNLYIFGPEGMTAMLKLESIYRPNPIAIGVEVTDEMHGLRQIVRRQTHPFGIRPIPDGLMGKVLDSIRSGVPPRADLIARIMESDPVSQEAIKTQVAIQGPILHVPSPLPFEYASVKQRELDSKLQRELQRLLNERYGDMYIG